MTKLKTLKDLVPYARVDNLNDENLLLLVNAKDLKAEAIKWVKELEERGRKKYGKDFFPMNVWKHFFNITEEDLK